MANKAHTVEDYRHLAQRRIPRFLFDYIDGGSFAEETLRRNIDDLRDVTLRQRVMQGLAEIDIGTSLFGEDWTFPVALAPIGMAGLAARRGEVQAARAAEKAGVPFCLSTVSACSLGEVRATTDKPFWLQLYMIKDRAFMRDLLAQAVAAECSALVFTVDMPISGLRYRDRRSGLNGGTNLGGALRRAAQAALRPGWLYDVGLHGRPHNLGNVAPVLNPDAGIGDFLTWMATNFDPQVTWKDVDWVRQIWSGPLIVKGILDVEDARAAADMGADGIIVSNHGGRQLDGAMSTVHALPAIVDSVGADLEVLVDGGVRSGIDIMRMLAIGAKAVLLGRPWVFALAANGEVGVTTMLKTIANEFRVAMILSGCANVAQIGRSSLARCA